jgi:hypothetical protein
LLKKVRIADFSLEIKMVCESAIVSILMLITNGGLHENQFGSLSSGNDRCDNDSLAAGTRRVVG